MKQGFEKRFKPGDIVYFHHQIGNKHMVSYGMVDEQFSDAVCIDYLEIAEMRKINGIPIDEFKSPSRYYKLPKGWSYDTRLFDLTWEKPDWVDETFKWNITKPEEIKAAYDKGYLVKSETKFHGEVETEIDKNGYRIVKKYPMWHPVITHTSIRPDRVYFTYQEAQAEVDEYMAELRRQCNLTDYEWAVEEIDKVLNRMRQLTDDERRGYRNWLLSQKNVEDIDVRLFDGYIQWKYWKNKKWHNIEYADAMRMREKNE